MTYNNKLAQAKRRPNTPAVFRLCTILESGQKMGE